MASTLAWLFALLALVAATSIALAWSLINLGHAACDDHLLLVALAIVVVAVPFEVGRGAAGGRFSVITRCIAPFTAWAVLLGLILSGLRLARVVGR